jgi:hypothetical protein
LAVPLAEVEIVDDWQVLGLLGSGGKSLILHDVFIPEHRSVMVSDLFAPASRVSRGVTRLAYMGRAGLAKASFPPHCLRRARAPVSMA